MRSAARRRPASAYQALLARLRDDEMFREALAAATTAEERAAVVRAAGLDLPDTDDVLQGVAGGEADPTLSINEFCPC